MGLGRIELIPQGTANDQREAAIRFAMLVTEPIGTYGLPPLSLEPPCTDELLCPGVDRRLKGKDTRELFGLKDRRDGYPSLGGLAFVKKADGSVVWRSSLTLGKAA